MPNIVAMIDHAILHPTATTADLERECALADRLGVASVCVKPAWIAHAANLLAESQVAVGTVIGFPHGSNHWSTKAHEAAVACRDGAVELDMVVNVGHVLESNWSAIQEDIQAVLQTAQEHSALLKVIFETDFVTSDDDKIQLCAICTDLGVDFVKTSTGFGYTKQEDGGMAYKGATPDDIELMVRHVGPDVGVKASGGIRTYDEAPRLVELGATRLGTSASQAIADQEGSDVGSY